MLGLVPVPFVVPKIKRQELDKGQERHIARNGLIYVPFGPNMPVFWNTKTQQIAVPYATCPSSRPQSPLCIEGGLSTTLADINVVIQYPCPVEVCFMDEDS